MVPPPPAPTGPAPAPQWGPDGGPHPGPQWGPGGDPGQPNLQEQQRPGPDPSRQSSPRFDDVGGYTGQPAPAPGLPDLPVRHPADPGPEFDRLRPHHSIPPQPGPEPAANTSDSIPPQPGPEPATNTSDVPAWMNAPVEGAATTSPARPPLLPPPPPLPDAPPTGGSDTGATGTDANPTAQQPLRRLPDLPPAPTEFPAATEAAGPDASAPPATPPPAPVTTPAPGPADAPDPFVAPVSGPPATAPESAPPAHPEPGPPESMRAPESAPHSYDSFSTGVGDSVPPDFHAPAPHDGGPRRQAPEAAPPAPAEGAPGQQWRAPEQERPQPPGPQYPGQQQSWQQPPGPAGPFRGPAGHGGPGPGQPPPNNPAGPQWQNQPLTPPQQQAGAPPAWQQQGRPPGQQWQQNPGQFGAAGPGGGPSLDDVSVRRAKKASGQGWRKVVHHASGGRINPGISAEERRLQELVARIRQPVRGDYRIAVLSLKGGVGKTTTTIGLGSTFASVRGDRVIAVDANPDFGTLSQRVPLQTRSTVRDLLLDPAIERYSDVRRHTSQGTSRLEVLASERDPAASEAFNEDEYRAVARILQRFYNIILTDCGTGLMHSAMAGVLQLAHSLVLISPTAIDGAQSASATLDWLSLHGYHHLVQNAVVVINSPRDGSPNIDVQQLRQYFLSRCRAVHMIPFDPHMSEGAEIDLVRLKKETKRAYVELAATVADDFTQSYRPHQGG
ncbi:nucleotide-binding protein [Nocardia sp. NBC_00416]|uniref:MinD/ParA family ATP-binding protein n=1 Tax=Nocardia sp. NBC_00416 TaxID=2975991 RepID=UPI003FA55182